MPADEPPSPSRTGEPLCPSAAVALTAALSLAACGSGDGASDSAKKEGGAKPVGYAPAEGDDGIPGYLKKDAGAPRSFGTINNLNLEAITNLKK